MKNSEKNYYDCKICLEESTEPVVTYCGHLYCWECLYKWSETKNNSKIPCPSCNNEVNIKRVIPIYTSIEEHSKRAESVPNRPKPERRQYRNPNNRGPNRNFQFHFNIFGMNLQGNGQQGHGNVFISIVPFILLVLIPILMNFVTSLGELIMDSFDNKIHQRTNHKPQTIAFIEYEDDFDLIIELCFYFFVLVFVSIIAFILVKNRRIPN